MINARINSIFLKNTRNLNSIYINRIAPKCVVTPYHFRNLCNQLLNSSLTNVSVPLTINTCRMYSSIIVNPSRNVFTISQYDKPIAIWLMGCSTLTLLIMLIGSYTRLTESGLSITEWSPIGSGLPTTDEDWIVEYNKYKDTPEYRMIHTNISMNDFKKIYFTEWFHRFVARLTGLFFFCGFTYFTYVKAIKPSLMKVLLGIGLLGGLQAIIGKVMVNSGLKEPKDGQIPRVSPLILSFHLLDAICIYSLCFWNALSLFGANKIIKIDDLDSLFKIKKLAYLLSGIALVTLFSGSIVAGSDAGFVCNTWPKINGKFIPDEIRSRSISDPVVIQFIHRSMAYLTGLSSIALGVVTFRSKLPYKIKKSVNYVLLAIIVQIMIGIDTLIRGVPVYMGVIHHLGAISVWTCLLHLLKRL